MKNKLHLIFTIGAIILFNFKNSSAISYPIQINNSFTINAANQFDLNQTETVGTLQSRLKTLLQHSELFPTGLYVQAGTTLTLNISALAGTNTAYGKVVITDRYAGGSGGAYTQTATLTNGNNTINVTVSGNIFVSYADANPNSTRKLRFTFNNGYTSMPCFIKDQTTTSEWLGMLQNNSSTPDVMFVFKRGVMVLDRTKIETYKNNNFNDIISALDNITDTEIEGSGIIMTANQSDKNRDFSNLLYFTSNDGDRVSTANPHAANPGLVRVPIDWIATTGHIFTGGAWGISHEIGHHIQQNSWDWGINTEVQVNIGTMMARKMLYPSATGMEGEGPWRVAGFYLNKEISFKDYDQGNLDLKAKIPVFWQLQLAFGNNDFYKRFYTYVRENPVNSGTAATEKLNFMKTANTISGKNLRDYFIQWGLKPTQTQINTLNAMGLSLPTISPLTYSETNLIENFTLLRDTTVYEGQAVTYKVVAMAVNGVKRVDFYDATTKIGESTEFPFQISFTPSFGIHPITARLIDASDNIVATTEVKNISATRIQITSPVDKSTIAFGANVLIKAKIAVIQDNAVQKVEFYDGITKLGESNSAPYQFVFNNPTINIHQITAKVTYQNGDISTSAPVYMNVGGLFPEADSYVRDGSYAGNNYGIQETLVVKEDGSSYKRYTYLRFKLNDIMANNLISAKLKLNIIGLKSDVNNKTDWDLYFVADDTWDENTINFNNQPVTGDLLATKRSVASGAVEWDISNQVNTELNGDKYISLVLKSSTKGANYDVSFGSKENQEVLFSPVLTFVSSDQASIETKITFPSSPQYYDTGEDVNIKVNTTIKPSNAVQKVELYDNNVKIAEQISLPYDFTISKIKSGKHSFTAKAFYQDGTESTADAVILNVGFTSPDADAYVQDGSSKNSNFGTQDKLVVKMDGVSYYRETYLRFNLSDIKTSTYAKALLKLNIISANQDVDKNNNQWEAYFIEDDAWVETSINYTNRPTTCGALLASIPAVKTGEVTWDITNQVNTELNGDKIISILIVATQQSQKGDVTFASKENTDESLRPILQFFTETQVLPINLKQFSAKKTPNGAQLNWTSNSEINSDNYQIWRSTDANHFSLVTTIKSKNQVNGALYQYIDGLKVQGAYYYKLTHTDFNGLAYQVGQVQTVNFSVAKEGLSIYPNPTYGRINITFEVVGVYRQFRIVDLQGNTIASGAIANGATAIDIDLTKTAKGTYIIRLSGANGNSTSKVVKL